MKKLVLIYTILSCCFLSFGQDTTGVELRLLPIIIEHPKLRHQPVGTLTENWKSEKLQNQGYHNLGDLLSNESGAYIKTYNVGGLATSSIRGGNALHTLVLWNDLPIRSPMLGQLDFAQLPLGIANSISFNKGGASTLWGSGAIGGVLQLSQTPNFYTPSEVNAKIAQGSFGYEEQSIQFKLGSKQLQSHTTFYRQASEGNFPFKPHENSLERELTNAGTMQQGLQQSFFYKHNNKYVLSGHIWYQNHDAKIPPLITQSFSNAQQNDDFIRLMLRWKVFNNGGNFDAKIGVFNEHQLYEDGHGFESYNAFNTVAADLIKEFILPKNYIVLLGSSYLKNIAYTAHYISIQESSRESLFFSLYRKKRNVKFQFSGRQTLLDDHVVPFLPSLEFDGQLNEYLKLKGKISRNFRFPTFNERFWEPGGNAELHPELGWSQEISVVKQMLNYRNKKWWTYSITGFNRNINNWILWYPDDDHGFWKASNVAEVWSRGIEQRLIMKLNSNKIKLGVKAGYDYLKSTYQRVDRVGMFSVGDQLLYTPQEKATLGFTVEYESFSFLLQQAYTGATNGIHENIDAFTLLNLNLNYTWRKDKLGGSFFVHFFNVLNEEYFIVERRPMPGINNRIGINVNFINQKKNKP